MADDVVERLGDGPMSAPWLVWFELANVCLNKIKRHPDQRESFIASFRRAEELGIKLVPVDHAGVIALAEQTGLTAYDASYLWVARHVNGPLVTLDDQLADAAQQG
jgi:predicted nucleic acid-binding protein